MTASNSIFVFHIRRPDGKVVFLHPFEDFEKIIAKGGALKIEGCYGVEPAVESLTAFRNTIYRSVEDSVNSWIMESRFIPRFITSAAVFLFTYFFLSFVIRDPLPMVDEVAAGIIAASVTYFLLGKKYRSTGTATRLRSHYRGIVDRIVFSESNFVSAVESMLAGFEGKSIKQISSAAANSSAFDETLSDENMEQRGQFLTYIEKTIKKEISSPQKKIINRVLHNRLDRSAELIEKLDLTEFTGDVDTGLLFVYLAVKDGKNLKASFGRGPGVD